MLSPEERSEEAYPKLLRKEPRASLHVFSVQLSALSCISKT